MTMVTPPAHEEAESPMTASAPTASETERFIEAGGIRIRYHDVGSGPVLLCIHGGAPGAFGWGNFGPNVPTLSQRYRMLVVDLPGYGGSQKHGLPDGDRARLGATVFAALLKELAIPRAHVVGLATGGAVAMRMAIDSPDLVDRLVLVSSAGGMPLITPSPSEGSKRIGRYYDPPGPTLETMRDYLEMIVFDRSLITDEIVEERYAASMDPEFIAHAPEGKATAVHEPVWLEANRIKARTLIVWGRNNVVQGYDNGLLLLNRIPDARMHVFGRTGRWVPFERREEFEALLNGFLDAS